MKTLNEYIKESLSLDMKLNETSLLDNFDDLDKSIDLKRVIESWILENISLVRNFRISDKPNRNGKYEVSAEHVIVGGEKSKHLRLLTNGMFVWKDIKMDFDCSFCNDLTSLEGAPEEVGRHFDCSFCNSLKSLKGAPEIVKGVFHCAYCKSLTSLEGAPEKVGADFNCSYCTSLKSLKGAPKEVDENFDCSGCTSLKSLKDAPEKVKNFVCFGCTSLKSLKDAPKIIKGNIDCRNCDSLKSWDLPKDTKHSGLFL